MKLAQVIQDVGQPFTQRCPSGIALLSADLRDERLGGAYEIRERLDLCRTGLLIRLNQLTPGHSLLVTIWDLTLR